MPTARARPLADRLARVFTALFVGAACALSGTARAQPVGPPPPPPGAEAPFASESAQPDGDGTLLIRTSWAPRDARGERRGTVTLQRRDASGAPRGAALVVYDGPAALTALAVREGAAGVALWRGGARPFVKLALVDLNAADVTRALADRAQIGRAAVSARSGVRLVNLARRAPRGYEPLSAVITPDAVGDGFAVLYQEMGPTQNAEAHSTLAVVTRAGRPTMRVVPVPWSLAALGDSGDRYVLAVRYDGGTAESTRLCFVTLSRAGQPEQHPWWGAPPDVVDEVQLVRTSAPSAAPSWVAVYRGGGTELGKIRAAPVDMSGSWGREAAAPRELGERARSAPWTVRSVAGALTLL
jgi:hypothetical protein